jgi:hypothetical protein
MSPPPSPTTYRTTGKALQSASRGRGVLIRATTPLGNPAGDLNLGDRKNLLQPTQEIAQGILRLLGGGY